VGGEKEMVAERVVLVVRFFSVAHENNCDFKVKVVFQDLDGI
jgi:hypothetical protein